MTSRIASKSLFEKLIDLDNLSVLEKMAFMDKMVFKEECHERTDANSGLSQ